jgi:biopolymer transport protein ExbD
MMREAIAAEKNMKLARREIKRVGELPQLWTTVMIRADKELEYEKVQRMMKVCQDLGFSKFGLRASPERRHM